MNRLALLAAALAFATAASAQVSVEPSAPKPQETVRIKVAPGAIGWPTYQDSRYNDFDGTATRVSMSGNKITVSVQLADNEYGAPSGGLLMPVGQFPVGDYQVEVVRRLPDGTPEGVVGMATFSVAGSVTDPLWNNTDVWWNSAEPGWGISIVQHGSGQVFAAWFLYDADKKPVWYVVPGGRWKSRYEFEGPIYRTSGPVFGSCGFEAHYACAFDPSAVNSVLVGTAVLGFSTTDWSRGAITMTIDGNTLIKTVARQPF